jgi:pseudaminic acid cytidylyltransferase
MSSVAIITARGGSKRIPRKNIKEFLGKPIIAYSIESAVESGLFDEVMVSTDDEEIAKIAQEYGATVPFYRSAKNSDDFSGTMDVIKEVVSEYKKGGKYFENICCIYPTAPFISVQRLKDSFKLLKKEKFDSVFPVCEFSFPVLRALKVDENSKASMFWEENRNTRSQDLPKSYHDAGQFYWVTNKTILENGQIYSDNSGVVLLSQMEVQDIDNEVDWSLAELKYKVLHGIS